MSSVQVVEDGEAKVRECEERLHEKDVQYDALNQRLHAVMQKEGELTSYVDDILLSFEKQSLATADAEARIPPLLQSISAFEGMKADYESQLMASRLEVEALGQVKEVSVQDAWTQIEPIVKESRIQQTDLSYQYLEAAEHLHTERGRTERLNNLKKASLFVDGLPDAQDFSFKTKTVVHGQDLRFEPQSKTKIVHVGGQASPSQTLQSTRRTPSPWS
eukprot:1613216-Amphidinium_carterae.1